jgi:hypothetical protein
VPDNGPPDDERLEAELRRAADRFDPVPQRLVDYALAAVDLRTLDAELAELVFDSVMRPEPVPVRGPDDCRMLTFRAGPLVIEVEVFEAGATRRIIGRVIPGAPAEITVERVGSRTTTTADDLGRFTVESVAAGPVRLHCRWPHGPAPGSVVTEWVVV